jgi:hypothetical protein
MVNGSIEASSTMTTTAPFRSFVDPRIAISCMTVSRSIFVPRLASRALAPSSFSSVVAYHLSSQLTLLLR